MSILTGCDDVEDVDDMTCASSEPGDTSGMASAGGMGGSGSAGGASECQQAGGICVSRCSCARDNGTVAASSPAGCDVDGVPAECCVPPLPQQNPTTCAEAGGLCTGIGGCLAAGGHYTSTDAGCDDRPGIVCCVPHDRCGEETIECCMGSWVAYPTCDNGMLICPMGGTPVPKGTCKVP
ncbi:hypothetical protein [Polyangium aurulentum]|uniref:hypothetical protein n=1 Tax=Polyangium aurulentum TaxID=2567896 RepID=UPI001F3C8937|nr:hypothetical protein [Polyangium aurulentum]